MVYRRFVSALLVAILLLGLLPVSPALRTARAAISDPGIGLPPGSRIDISAFSIKTLPQNPLIGQTDIYFESYWSVYVDGKYVGQDILIKDYVKSGSQKGRADGHNFVAYNYLSQWAEAMGGNPSFVSKYAPGFKLKINGSDRIHIRYLIALCGANLTDWKTAVELEKGRLPEPVISVSPSVKENEPVNIGLQGTGFVEITNDYVKSAVGASQGLTYTFKIDGTTVISNKKVSTNRFNDTVTRSFTAGTHTLTLIVTDVVGRSNEQTVTIAVKGSSQPPVLPGGNQPPVADFSMPQQTETGVTVNITDSSYDPDGTITNREWTVTPSSGVTKNLGNSGGTLKFSSEGTYTVTLTVTDNKGAQASKTKTILVGESAPPPPPPAPPEPENIPPVARISMPVGIGQGGTVQVKNTSYDPDGEIVEVEWDVSPRSGVVANLTDSGGSITFNETGTFEVTITVTDDRGDSNSATKTITVTNEPPKAKINAPDEVIQGNDVTIRSDSYDPDGEISTHEWAVTPTTGVMGTLSGEESTIWFDKEGEYTVTLTVKDKWGLSDTTTKTIKVLPAVPLAYFDFRGSLKENRKIILDASQSKTSDRYPMVWDATRWEILPPAGGSADDIKIATSSDLTTRTVLFKRPGDYTVRLQVKNTAGHYSEWYQQVLTIFPDKPPVADFFVQTSVLRDPNDSNYASIKLVDASYSPDGDTIGQRIWRYQYDSNNNGDFSDETWQTLDSGNNITPVLRTTQVGKYRFELTVKESFGEETIPGFVTSADYKTDDTSDKPVNDKIVEVMNMQPSVDFEIIRKKKADIVFTVGKADQSKINNLNAKIASIVQTKLAANNIEANITAVETAATSTESQDPNLIFSNWRSFYVNGSGTPPSGTWSYDSSLNAVVCNVGSRPAVGWYNPNAFSTKDITISYTLGLKTNATNFEHGEMGFIFRMKDEKNYYVYIIDNHSACGNVLYDQRSVLAKVQNGSFSVVKTGGSFPYFYAGQTWNVRIEVKGNNIKILRDGNLDIDWTDTSGNSYDSGSYGFYVWDQPAAYYKNIQITTESIKTLDEAVKTTTWNQYAGHFLVNISDVLLPELEDPVKLALILSNFTTNYTHFIGLGTSSNKTQLETFISRNDGRGAFFYNTDMNTALNQTADYIINVLKAQSSIIEQYVLLGEEVTYTTYYVDSENDPKFEERWLYTQDPYYFENSLGYAPFHNTYISAPVTKFDKVGKYDVVFQARDNPKPDNRFDNYRLWSSVPVNKLILYVHRKPIASFTASLTPAGTGSALVTEDFEDTNYGFSFSGNWSRSSTQKYAGQYSFKSASIGHGSSTSTQFTYTIPSGVQNARISFYYLVRSEASYDYFNFYINGSRVIHTSGYGSWTSFSYNLSPGATYTFTFEYAKDGSVSDYDDAAYVDNLTVQYDGTATSYNVQLTSTSYDLDHQSEPGKGIVAEEWKWKEPTATSWNSGKPSTLAAEKTYLVWLRVKDKEGAWSDPYVKTLSTMNANLPPVAQFSVAPSTQVANKPITITDQSYDPNGDPLAEWKWRVKKPDGTWVNYGGTKPENVTSLGPGTYTIELTVRDNPRAGTTLWSEPFTQTVNVIPENNQPVAAFTIAPNPIIADEPYTINETSYDPDGDPIVSREWKVQKPDGTWVTIPTMKPTFEEMGFDDDGTYTIGLRVLDDPTGRHPALTPLWSTWVYRTVQVESPLSVTGNTDKTTYRAGEAIRLRAQTDGKAYRVEAQMWYPRNEFTSTNITTLIADMPLTDPPQKSMTWHSKQSKAEGFDVVAIIPKNTPDGTYSITFRAYKRRADGSVKIATHSVPVQVKGHIYDDLLDQIISPY